MEKKTTTKKTPTTEVPPAELDRFKNQMKVAITAAKTVELNLKRVASDIKRLADEVPDPPRIIEGERDLRDAQQSLRVLQLKRRRLGQMQQACTRAKVYWEYILDEANGWLLSQPSIAALKNDTIRKHWIRKVLGALMKRQALLKGYLKEIEDLLWIIKDNQRGTIGMVSAFKEEAWANRVGLE